MRKLTTLPGICTSAVIMMLAAVPASAQLTDTTDAPNTINAGIRKSVAQEIGTGRGGLITPDSSIFIINRDPFRAIQRGRQLFQRKWTRAQGQGPGVNDGVGNLDTTPAIGSGLTDSCAMCHSQPAGSAGVGGSNTNRPDTRNAPHLFGVGIKEMLGDEITGDLRAIRDHAIDQSRLDGRPVIASLDSKGINYGSITAFPDGHLDTDGIEGCDRLNPAAPCAIERNLRVNVFGWQGNRSSLREFVGGPVPKEVMGLILDDPDLHAACTGSRVVTPSGKVLDGTTDHFDCPPNDPVEQPVAVVDYLEFYLLHYFKPGTHQQTPFTEQGRRAFQDIGCARCHVLNLRIDHDRRAADVETVFDEANGIFNRLFATATPLFRAMPDDGILCATASGSRPCPVKAPLLGTFTVRSIGTDFKRHNLGPNFWERNFDGTIRKMIKTPELWGVGSTPAYGHDGRSINLAEVILRHGGDAQVERDAFASLSLPAQRAVLDFLNSLVIFSPPNTASNLDPGNRGAANFPQNGHGSIRLQTLFNDTTDPE